MPVQYTVTSGNVTTGFTAATARTMVEAATTANVPGELIQLDVSLYFATATAPALVEFGTNTAVGTGTAYTAKRVGAAIGTAATTFKVNDTVEPAGWTQVLAWLIPAGSMIPLQLPLGRELMFTTSAWYGVRITFPTSSTAMQAAVNLWLEE